MDLSYPVRTERLFLRPFVAEDLDELYDILRRPEVHRYLYSQARTREEVREKLDERIAKYSKLTAAGDSLILAVVRADTGAMIGDVLLHWLSEEHRSAEIGYVLHPDHAGKGFAAEATRPLIRHGFEVMGLHRIIGRLDARNTASARVLTKLGMRQEAHFRENERVKGEWVDELVYAVLADEWRA